MAKLDIPTVRGLYVAFIADYESRTGQTRSLLRSAFVRTFGWVFAGLIVLCYRYGRWVYLQQFLETCSSEALTLYGRRVGLSLKDGSPSVATVTLNGVTALSIAAGTTFVKPSTGILFKTSALTSVIDGVALCVITSTVQGEVSILNIGDELQLVSSSTGVPDSGIVTDVTTEGAEPETQEDFRQRVQSRYRMKAQGGAFGDYWLWATEVDGIADAFPYAIIGGTVNVYAVASGSGAERAPTAEKLEEVEASIRQSPDSTVYDRQPVQSALEVYAPLFVPVTVAITGLTISAMTAQNKANIRQAIINYLDTRKPEIPALGYPASDATISPLAISAEASNILSQSDRPGTFTGISITVNGGAVTTRYLLGVGTLANLTSLTINGLTVS